MRDVRHRADHNLLLFSSRRRHTILQGDWSSDVCSSDLFGGDEGVARRVQMASALLAVPRSKVFPDAEIPGDVVLSRVVVSGETVVRATVVSNIGAKRA